MAFHRKLSAPGTGAPEVQDAPADRLPLSPFKGMISSANGTVPSVEIVRAVSYVSPRGFPGPDTFPARFHWRLMASRAYAATISLYNQN